MSAFAAASPIAIPQSSNAPIAGFLVLVDPSSAEITGCVGSDGKFTLGITSANCEVNVNLTQVNSSGLLPNLIFINSGLNRVGGVTLTTSDGNCGVINNVFVCGADIPVTVIAVSLLIFALTLGVANNNIKSSGEISLLTLAVFGQSWTTNSNGELLETTLAAGTIQLGWADAFVGAPGGK